MDPSPYIPFIALWSSTEIAAAVVALCMPWSKVIFDHLLSNSPTSSDPDSPKYPANSDDSHMKPMHRVPIGTGAAPGINGSEESLWTDITFFSANSHK
jgi:hypothetical protein